MRFRKSLIACVSVLIAVALGSCAPDNAAVDDDKISIVCTSFPGYDFVRQLTHGIDGVEFSMLLKPGSESHSYEPTPQDIISVKNCDMFVYVGGESDEWAKNILGSVDTDHMKIIALIDCVDLVEEEIVEGMDAKEEHSSDEHLYEPEYDEHVWTSPVNSIEIVRRISEALCSILSENDKSICENNTETFISQLSELDSEFKAVADGGARKVIVFGDRFPFRYFADEYGLEYYAAFPGCSSETEASAKTVSFLIDMIKSENIPVVFYPELSNKKIAETICESTNAKAMQMNSCHNVTSDEFESGVTYISLMKQNVEALKYALN